jgi:hypothetical protein
MRFDLVADLTESDPVAGFGMGARCVLECHGSLSWPARAPKSIAHEADQGSVTRQPQGARTRTSQN